MTRCPDADTLRYGIFYTAVLADDWRRDGSGDSRDGDGDDGDARDAPDLFGDDGAHRDGDGLGNHGQSKRLAEVEQFARCDDAENAGEASDADAREYGQPVLFEVLDLLVEGNGEHDGDGTEEKRDIVAADFVGVVADSRCAQEGNDEHVRDQERID